MTDLSALLLLVSAQLLVSFVGGWKFAHRGLKAALVPALILPSVTVTLGLWMAFGMGRVTDLGAMAIAALIVCTIILTAVGLPAALIAVRLRK